MCRCRSGDNAYCQTTTPWTNEGSLTCHKHTLDTTLFKVWRSRTSLIPRHLNGNRTNDLKSMGIKLISTPSASSYRELILSIPSLSIPRTRQIIRYRATATLRRLQIKQYTASNDGRGYKTHGNIPKFWLCSGAPDSCFRKLFLIRDAKNFDKSPNSIQGISTLSPAVNFTLIAML